MEGSTSTARQVKSPPQTYRVGESNRETIKIGLISVADVVSALTIQFFFLICSTMEIATSIIRINAFSLRKPITDLAGLKTKPRTESTRPSRIPPILLPRVLKPYSTPLTTDFRPPVNELTITPIVVITARTTAETVRPYFLKVSHHLSEWWSSL